MSGETPYRSFQPLAPRLLPPTLLAVSGGLAGYPRPQRAINSENVFGQFTILVVVSGLLGTIDKDDVPDKNDGRPSVDMVVGGKASSSDWYIWQEGGCILEVNAWARRSMRPMGGTIQA